MISNLKIFDSVEVLEVTSDKKVNSIKTKIEDISIDNVFYVTGNADTFSFQSNSKYKIFRNTDLGVISWDVVYEGPAKIENIFVSKFKAIRGPFETQRREFFRQPISINCELAPIKTPSNIPLPRDTRYSIRMVDVSGGGSAILSNDTFASHSFCVIDFLFNNERFSFVAEILHRDALDASTTSWKYRYRIKWDDINENKDIETLIASIFAHQRKILNTLR